MEAREILGLDVGLARTGIARSTNVAKLAEPLYSVPTKQVTKTLIKYLSEHRVEAIAVGLPRNLKGEETDQTAWTRNWVDVAKRKIDAPLYWQDEALTTVKAEDLKHRTKDADIDSISAAIILQDFLNTPEADKLIC